MRRLLNSLIALLALISVGAVAINLAPKSDSFLMDRVVKLVSPQGSCTGEQVEAPSGETYVLTAAHCKGLIVNGSIEAITENNHHLNLKVIAEDSESDLLLLEGVKELSGLQVASQVRRGEHIITYTHGHGYKTYRTDGVIIDHQRTPVLLGVISSDIDRVSCSMPKNRIVTNESIFGSISYCLLYTIQNAITAFTAPGSSGGPVVNNHGDLIGVVSAGGGGYNYLVRLEDIQAFLSDR